MIIRIRLNGLYDGNAWYMRGYLNGRACTVVAITSTGFEVRHPISNKSGYYVSFGNAEIIEGINERSRLSDQMFHFSDV